MIPPWQQALAPPSLDEQPDPAHDPQLREQLQGRRREQKNEREGVGGGVRRHFIESLGHPAPTSIHQHTKTENLHTLDWKGKIPSTTVYACRNIRRVRNLPDDVVAADAFDATGARLGCRTVNKQNVASTRSENVWS